MAGNYLLDTSVLIAALRGDATIIGRLSQATEILTSAVALGELHVGAQRSARPQETRDEIESLTEDIAVLPCDSATAYRYAALKDALRRKGRPIPDNDLWIAATANQHNLTLVSRDRHFNVLDGLDQEIW